jgi:tetratricopeptide (TPR) repeat protein
MGCDHRGFYSRDNKTAGKMNTQENNRLFHPGWIVPVALLSGAACAGGCAFFFLSRCSGKARAWLVASGSLLVEALILWWALVWPVKWYWTALAVYSVHAVAGILLYTAVRAWCGPAAVALRMHPFARLGLQKEVVSAIGGAAGMICVAPGLIVSFMLLSNWLFSALLPVGIDNADTLSWTLFLTGCAVLGGSVGGAVFIRVQPTVSLRSMFGAILAYLFSYLTFWFWLEVLMAIPSFQAASCQGRGFSSVMGPVTGLQFAVGTWWSVVVAVYLCAPGRRSQKAIRWAQVFVLHMSTMLVLSLSWGYPADLFLATGKFLERHARVNQALACYERGLTKKPEKETACWLQYRVALLYRKQGNIDRAQEGFRRVVATYNADDELVKQSNYFLKRLDEFGNLPRVVLPGVETRTVYRGSYCVPNSMALVMRFWGRHIDAARIGAAITGLSSGTYAVDQAWFAHDCGMKHDFLTLATLGDIKRCIDAGFPVLVYVPAHALVLFGYDEALSTFVTYDVATNEIWTDYIQRDFVRAWKRQAATLVLVYPPEKAPLLPADIRERCRRSTAEYIHFQIQFFDTLRPPETIAHLKLAAGDKGEFFLPAATLYMDYPGLRDSVAVWFDSAVVAQNIVRFFGRDYDEGVHLWGHIHYEEWALPDWDLRYGIRYCLAHGMYALAESLVTAIENKGTVSDLMVASTALPQLAMGNLRRGVAILDRCNVPDYDLYYGLACEKLGKKTEAIKSLRYVVQQSFGGRFYKGEDEEYEEGYSEGRESKTVDEMGYPAVFIANEKLCALTKRETVPGGLVKTWEAWSRAMPGDTQVAASLIRAYDKRIANLAKKDEPYVYSNLVEKRDIVRGRLDRNRVCVTSAKLLRGHPGGRQFPPRPVTAVGRPVRSVRTGIPSDLPYPPAP